MSKRRLILAGPLLIACVAGMSAAGDRAPATAAERCPGVSVDTRQWRLTRSFEFGVEILHPASYERKLWENVSPGMPRSLEFWRDKPAWRIGLTLLPTDSMRPFLPHRHGRTLRCTMGTRSGDGSALLERVANTTLPTERDSFYSVRVRLPRSDGRTVIAFEGTSIDSAGHVEQIAIARSLRLVRLNASGK
jgi:hypothetical protein